MGFKNIKKSGHHDSGFWVSYSDLFMNLSMIFLVLYAVAQLNMRTSAMLIQSNAQQLSQENEQLKQQIKVYETLKDEYMNQQATEAEKENYDELMGKLSLLQEEARKEKNDLIAQANENAKKEKALNKYQAMIKGIINANMVSQSRIKRRDNIISENETEIKDLAKEVKLKKAQVAKSEKLIEETQDQLDQRLRDLDKARKNNKITKKIYEQQQKKLKAESEAKVQALLDQKQQVEKQVASLNTEMSNLNQTLVATEGKAKKLEVDVQKAKEKVGSLENEIAQRTQAYEAKVAAAKAAAAKEAADAKAAFDAKLAAEKLGVQAKLAQEAEFRRQAQARERQLGEKLAGLGKEFSEKENQLKAQFNAQLGAKEGEFNSKLGQLKSELGAKEGEFKNKLGQLESEKSALAAAKAGTEAELAIAREAANARKNLAAKIAANFAKSGVKAEVDGRTGEVVLDFGEHYFDTDRANLKVEMKKVLEKALPGYTEALFNDPRIANKIASVDIIGFASPTYKGRVVDMNSGLKEDREAAKYNLDLSYKRARAIYEHIYSDKMMFNDQNKLRPLLKVTGRSFFTEAERLRIPAGKKVGADFCAQYDCKKAQRVMIKFNLKD